MKDNAKEIEKIGIVYFPIHRTPIGIEIFEDKENRYLIYSDLEVAKATYSVINNECSVFADNIKRLYEICGIDNIDTKLDIDQEMLVAKMSLGKEEIKMVDVSFSILSTLTTGGNLYMSDEAKEKTNLCKFYNRFNSSFDLFIESAKMHGLNKIRSYNSALLKIKSEEYKGVKFEIISITQDPPEVAETRTMEMRFYSKENGIDISARNIIPISSLLDVLSKATHNKEYLGCKGIDVEALSEDAAEKLKEYPMDRWKFIGYILDSKDVDVLDVYIDHTHITNNIVKYYAKLNRERKEHTLQLHKYFLSQFLIRSENIKIKPPQMMQGIDRKDNFMYM